MPTRRLTKWSAFAIALLVGLLLDQGSKVWARASLKPRHPPVIAVVGRSIELSYVENRGGAFSMLSDAPGGRLLFLAVAAGFLGVLAIALARVDREQRLIAASIGLLVSGVLGNSIDRALQGAVTDFILCRIGEHRWPTFNVADAALLLGGGLLLLGGVAPRRSARAA